MTDIVKRLRGPTQEFRGLHEEAANVIDALRQQLHEEHEAHLISEEQWISRHEVALEAAHYEAVKVVALKRELATETNNKQEFERDWLACCDKLNDERRIHLELEETLVKKLEAAQAREKVLRSAINALLDFAGTVAGGSSWWEDVWEANKYEGIQYGQGDDTALKAALAVERERYIKAIQEIANCVEYDGDTADECIQQIRALGD